VSQRLKKVVIISKQASGADKEVAHCRVVCLEDGY
jgi:hypothetical protein